jgi:GNAT superfamily N-acetyltransferase
MQSLAAECWRLDPQSVNSAASVGELAWDHGAPQGEGEEPKRYRLWRDGDDIVAWGALYPPMMVTRTAERQELSKATLVWQVRPGRIELLDDILDWFAAETPGQRQTFVREANLPARERIQARGYIYDPSDGFDIMNTRDLRQIATPRVPPGYRLATMAEINDVEKRVAVHRAAWEPSSLTVEKYRGAMSTPTYRAEFDFVVVAPDGSLACSALGWYDEANRAGEFEPVGTHPDHRRLGLASAALLFGMQRFRDAGATHAIIGCRGDDSYPIPKLVYHGLGFKEISRDLPYVHR